ncbi:MAG: hypothetical protein ABFR19_00455 [Pseudomonadota bacterium]
MKNQILPSALLLLSMNECLSAATPTSGEVTTHTSPNKIEERCVILDHIPGGEYSTRDEKTEQAYCSIDLHRNTTALCPRSWSSTPGAVFYLLSAGPYRGKAGKFEAVACSLGKSAANYTTGKPIEFISSIAMQEASGAFSASPLLYYHFSRYFNTHIRVPVAVLRTMDSKVHRQRVTQRGIELAATNKTMNLAAWKKLNEIQQKPELASAAGELFTEEGQQISGVMQHSAGMPYGELMNGASGSDSGVCQNPGYQQTPAFQALRSTQPLKKAIREALAEAANALHIAAETEISDQQMAYWMQDLTEIALLDHIFNQQGRDGNIAFEEWWYWKKGSTVRKQFARTKTAPRNLARHKPGRIMETYLNDNESGGRVSADNLTRDAGVLSSLRHFNPDTYKQLIRLDRDFSKKRKLYQYLKQNFALSEQQFQQIVANTREAAEILRTNCKEKKLRFDLRPNRFFARGSSSAKRLNCNKP